MDRQSLEPGLMLFIKRKLENSVPLREITEMLLRAGFTEKQIEEAVQEVHNKFPETHQDIVASNNFLPPLKEKKRIEEVRPETVKQVREEIVYPAVVKKGLFSGRLRRRDFILGFLLFFSAGMVLLSLILGIFSFAFPDFTSFTQDITSPEYKGLWLLLLPIVLSPISILLLSIIARRLHDLSFPGGIAFGFLIFFIDPMSGVLSMYGIFALQLMMVVIFIMLLVVRGTSRNNENGMPPPMKGSTFAKIFNSQ